jgi:transcriptional regulator with XRE-family HTH domain
MGRPPKTSLPSDLSSLLRVIGANITALREEKGLSQAELARKSQVSTTTLNEVETRQFRDIRLSTLSSLARTLDIPVVRLLQSSDVELQSRDQVQLLKASEAILRITRKLRAD